MRVVDKLIRLIKTVNEMFHTEMQLLPANDVLDRVYGYA